MIEATGYQNEIKPVVGGPIDGQARICRAGERAAVVRSHDRWFIYRIDLERIVYVGWSDDAVIAERAARAVAAGTFGSAGHGEGERQTGRSNGRIVAHRPGL